MKKGDHDTVHPSVADVITVKFVRSRSYWVAIHPIVQYSEAWVQIGAESLLKDISVKYPALLLFLFSFFGPLIARAEEKCSVWYVLLQSSILLLPWGCLLTHVLLESHVRNHEKNLEKSCEEYGKVTWKVLTTPWWNVPQGHQCVVFMSARRASRGERNVPMDSLAQL